MNAETPIVRAERIQVFDPIHVLDSGRFDQMQRIATVMARSPLTPESLVCFYEGTGQNKKAVLLDWDVRLANCFLVVNQAVRWGLDPFAVAQSVSVVHGKLMFEGKLVAAVLDAKLGEKLSYEWNDQPGDLLGIRIEGSPDARGKPRVLEGTVGQWRTAGAGSPWTKAADHRRQLVYRGTRDWARLYEPAVLLGVYTPDEMEHLQDRVSGEAASPASGPPRQVRGKAKETPQLTHQPVQEVVPTVDTAPKAEQAAAPAKPQEPAAKHVVGQTPQDIENARELEAAVAGFEAAAAKASTRQELEAAEELVSTYQDNDLFGLAQRNRISGAWEDADVRISNLEARAARDAEQKPDAIDTESPAYRRGYEDRKRNIGRCLKPEFKNDPAQFALWEAGHAQASRDLAA